MTPTDQQIPSEPSAVFVNPDVFVAPKVDRQSASNDPTPAFDGFVRRVRSQLSLKLPIGGDKAQVRA